MPAPALETARLLLRPLELADLDALALLHAEPSFWHYPFRRGWSREETEAFLHRTLKRYEDPGIAVSAVVSRCDARLLGWAGLSIPTYLPEMLPAVEVGWRLGRQHWGRGYATEAGRAWLTYAFGHLGADRVLSVSEPDNQGSLAVMRRLGFTLDREATHPDRGVPLVVMARQSPALA